MHIFFLLVEKKTPLVWYLPSADLLHCNGIKEMPFLKTSKPYSFAYPSIICSCIPSPELRMIMSYF